MAKKREKSKPFWKDKYMLFAVLLLILQVAIIIRNIYLKTYLDFFWYCDFVPILLAIAFLKKDEQFIKGVINIGLLAQLLFLVDFVFALFSGKSLFGFSEGMLTSGAYYFLLEFLIHIDVILALFLTYKTKPSTMPLIYSAMLVFLMYGLSLGFTTPVQNINSVYRIGSGIISWQIPYLTVLWPLITLAIVVLPTYGLQYLLYKFYKKKIRDKNL